MQDRANGHLPLSASILSADMPEKDSVGSSRLECEPVRAPLGQMLNEAALAEVSEAGSQASAPLIAASAAKAPLGRISPSLGFLPSSLVKSAVRPALESSLERGMFS